MTWFYIFLGIMVFIAIKVDDYKVDQKIRYMDKYNLNHGQMTIDSLNGMSGRQVARKMAAGGYYKYRGENPLYKNNNNSNGSKGNGNK